MTDACQILRPGPGRVVYDPVTRRATNRSEDFFYDGPCRLWEIPANASIRYQDLDLLVTTMFLSLPFDAVVPEPESQVKMTYSDDPSVIGRYYQIEAIVRSGGLRGARRMLVNAIDTSSALW
jgi:hypothetical protein